MAAAQKVQFEAQGNTWEVYTNGKEYGAKKVIYLSVSRVGSKSERKGAYSLEEERFTQYGAGELDILKAATKALGITE